MSPFLHRCQCTRGFFVLRPCDAPAAYTCSSCARTVCNDHWSVAATPPACLECVARRDEARSIADDDFDAPWFHRYRHRYYTTYHYRPFYDGVLIGTYYDDYDVRAFDAAAIAAGAGAPDADDDAPGGLGDS